MSKRGGLGLMRLAFTDNEWAHLMTFEHMREAFGAAQSPANVRCFVRVARQILRQPPESPCRRAFFQRKNA